MRDTKVLLLCALFFAALVLVSRARSNPRDGRDTSTKFSGGAQGDGDRGSATFPMDVDANNYYEDDEDSYRDYRGGHPGGHPSMNINKHK